MTNKEYKTKILTSTRDTVMDENQKRNGARVTIQAFVLQMQKKEQIRIQRQQIENSQQYELIEEIKRQQSNQQKQLVKLHRDNLELEKKLIQQQAKLKKINEIEQENAELKREMEEMRFKMVNLQESLKPFSGSNPRSFNKLSSSNKQGKPNFIM